MTIARRPKQPERVRRQLLDAAAHLALVGQGTAAITVEGTCLGAGVTKGAFFHHFPTKAHLVRALFDDLLERFDLWLAERMAADPDPHGRFTRAYVAAVTEPGTAGSEPLWAVAYVSALSDPELRLGWARWLGAGIAAAAEDPEDRDLVTARLAADGLWLAQLSGSAPAALAPLRAHLLSLTRKVRP